MATRQNLDGRFIRNEVKRWWHGGRNAEMKDKRTDEDRCVQIARWTAHKARTHPNPVTLSPAACSRPPPQWAWLTLKRTTRAARDEWTGIRRTTEENSCERVGPTTGFAQYLSRHTRPDARGTHGNNKIICHWLFAYVAVPGVGV